MKILLSAYSCEPGRGSEPGVGWNIAKEVAKNHDVWVLTRPEESQEKIEAELAQNPIPSLHFVYFTTPFFGGLWKLNQSGAMQLHYYLWQITAYFIARRLNRQIGFDIIHHVTFVRHSTPSFLSLLPVPFIWGPVGGGESAPGPFWKDFTRTQKLYEIARSAFRWLGERDPFTSLTAQRSAVVYATTTDTAVRIRRYLGRAHVEISPAIGIAEQDILNMSRWPDPDQNPVRFISMGRLLHWKGFHLGLRAFALARLPEAEYWVVGDGPEANRLAILAEQLGISSQVKFWGNLPREEALQRLAEAQALVHPSLHDSGGWVCLEAMAAGRPVVCLNLGGPAQEVTEATGLKITPTDIEQTVRDLANAMVQLANHPEQRVVLGRQGRQRVKQYYTWEAKGKALDQTYQKVLAKHQHKN